MEDTMHNTLERRRIPKASRRMEAVRTMLDLVGRFSPGLAAKIVFELMIRPRRRIGKMRHTLPFLRAVRVGHLEGSLQAYDWPGDRRVLLVHGWDGNSADFVSLIASLSRAGWGGMVYDAPAHGMSDGSTTDFLDLEEAFRGVLSQNGPFDAVVAHSFGAVVALHQLEESGEPIPRRIIAVGAPASLAQSFQVFTEPLHLAPAVWENLDQRIERRLGQSAGKVSAIQASSNLQAEMLFIHDRDDGMVPAEAARRLSRTARQSELMLTSGLGHRGWFQHQPTLDAVVSFLSE